MRPEAEYQQALELIREDINDCEIGRRLGIPRGTIRDWRTKPRSVDRARACFRCAHEWFDQEAYSYLLGVYLGDGCLTPHARSVYKLRIACDLKYPDIINEIANHIVVVRGVEKVGFALSKGCVDVNAYWKHWPCLFPQHGPGRKHERKIELQAWQRRIVADHAKPLIRGSSILTATGTSTK